MFAIILVGGRGTRLSDLHPGIPKALAPVAGRPFLQWQLEWLLRGNVKRAHLACGHMADQLIAWAAEDPVPGLELTCSIESAPLGTAGGLCFAAKFTSEDSFFVMNGDSLLPNLSFERMAEAFCHSEADGMLAITSILKTDQYGTVDVGENDRIIAFREKTRCAKGCINAGVYLLRRSVLDAIPVNQAVSLETEIFPGLASAGRLSAFRVESPLLDMGTPNGIDAMSEYLLGSAMLSGFEEKGGA